MHAGCQALRNALAMELSRLDPRREVGADVEADIGRILQIWRDCREGFGAGGDFLFGRACIADAFYAPVVTRFRSYGIELDDVGEAYVRTVTAWPAMREWTAAAAEESEVIVRSEEHTSELQSLIRISYAVCCLKQKTSETRTLT